MDKVILITGASRGIGREIALTLARAGAKVIVNFANSAEAAEEVVSQIEKEGGKAITVKADVSSRNEVTDLFDKAIKHFGKVDVLINNAGVLKIQLLKDVTDEDFESQFDVNVKGVFNTMQEAHNRLSDNGFILNISSSTTKMMLPLYAVYSASKAAVEQMTRVFSKEIGRGISVNALCPGPTKTELFLEGKSQELIDKLIAMNNFGRLAEPIDIAKVVEFLVSDNSKWISGQVLPVNGGAV